MSNFLECLESRTFLSVTPAVVTLHADEAAVKADLKVLAQAGAAALKTIKADLKSATVQSIAKSQEKAFSKALANISAAIGRAIPAAVARVNPDVTRFEALAAQVGKKPGNAALAAKFSAAEAALTTAAANGLSAFNAADNGTAIVAALNTIIADGGATSTDAGNALSSLAGDSQTTSAAAGQAFSNDVATIVGH